MCPVHNADFSINIVLQAYAPSFSVTGYFTRFFMKDPVKRLKRECKCISCEGRSPTRVKYAGTGRVTKFAESDFPYTCMHVIMSPRRLQMHFLTKKIVITSVVTDTPNSKNQFRINNGSSYGITPEDV